MTDYEILQDYRWAVREREVMAAQLTELTSEQWERPEAQGLHNALEARERRRLACAEALGMRDRQLASITVRLE